MSERIDKAAFEKLYLKVREKENRIYRDEEVSELPNVRNNHPHFEEWVIRKYSFKKLDKYLREKNKPLHILDIGCGNGWMSNALSEINNSLVTGFDINLYEIEQAQRVFKNNKGIKFIHDNGFENILTKDEKFDSIILAASIQYFPDIKNLIKKLFHLLNTGNEIHILDSHFYTGNNMNKAKEASLNYYNNIGFPEMGEYYYHHLWTELADFNFKIKNRSLFEKIFLKIFQTKSNYFPWIIIKK